MRPLVMMLVMTLTGLAAAQEPIPPAAAVDQADDDEVPNAVQLKPPPPPKPMLETPRRAGTGILLLPPAPGYGYRVVDAPPVPEKRWGLFTAGVVMLSVAWCANLQAGIPTGEWRLDVPLLGPLLEIERLGGGDPFVGFVDLMLVTDAAVQLGGLAMMIAGGTTYKNRPAAQRIELVPLGAGAAIRGSF
jgi:hypothetical protein